MPPSRIHLKATFSHDDFRYAVKTTTSDLVFASIIVLLRILSVPTMALDLVQNYAHSSIQGAIMGQSAEIIDDAETPLLQHEKLSN